MGVTYKGAAASYKNALILRMVSNDYKYRMYSLDTEEKIIKFTTILGLASVLGVRKRIPRKDSEVTLRNFDVVNCVKKIEILVNLYTSVPVCL
jgi:hypothetical protein